MIVARLTGGLGNQMFQYAAGRALAERLGVEFAVDIRDFDHYRLHAYGLECFNVKVRRASLEELSAWPRWQCHVARLLKRLGGWGSVYMEPHFGYDPRWCTLQDGMYLSGYFQSEAYFASIAGDLREEFVPTASLSTTNRMIAEMIRNSESVAIHVRRGDYVTDSKTLRFHGVCSPDYYSHAISRVRQEHGQARFVVFSNDLDWARSNLHLGEDAIFVDGNERCPEMDIYLMAQCRHHIVANSSFSWWGAWLARREGQRVIAPEPWFDTDTLTDKDLVPKTWVRLSKS